jgi:excisionase family DNA binding protein
MRPEDTGVAQLGALLAAMADSPRLLGAVTQRLDELGAKIDAIARRLPPALASASEAARQLGVSVPTVRRRIRSGELPIVRLGGRVLVDLGAITAPSADEIAERAILARQRAR